MATDPRAPSGDERSDADLLEAHVGGDHDAFGVLFARHRDRLWAVAVRTMGNPDDAADGLQDGMVAAYRRAASYRGDAAVTTWLHRVVVNACLDRIRAAKVRRADPLPDDLEEYGRRAAATAPAGGAVAPTLPVDPAEAAVTDERRSRVLAALAELPEEQRAALVLVDMEGYPVAEVAEMLECAVGTVKSRCSRGRARLAPLLADLLDGDEAHTEAAGDDGNPPGSPLVRSMKAPRAPPRP